MKKLIIVLFLISILAFILTGVSIVIYKTNHTAEIQVTTVSNNVQTIDIASNDRDVVLYKEYHLPIQDDTKGATLSQTYDINNIKLSKEEIKTDKYIARYFKISRFKRYKH